MFQLSHLVKSVVKFDIKCVFTHQGSLVCSANSVTRVFDGVFCKIQNLPCCTHKGKNKCQFTTKTSNTYIKISSFINACHLTDSYIVFTLKMKSVSRTTIFGLKMMVKSGLEKFILKSLHAGR